MRYAFGALPAGAWERVSNGTFTGKVFYTDAANNTGSASFAVEADKFAPSIEVHQPTQGQEVGRDGFEFDLHVVDSHLASVWYTLDYGLTNYTLASGNTRVDSAAWDAVWGYGRTLEILVFANDTLGNEASASIIVKCASKPPLWQRLGVLGWGIIAAIVVGTVVLIAVHAHKQKKAQTRTGGRS